MLRWHSQKPQPIFITTTFKSVPYPLFCLSTVLIFSFPRIQGPMGIQGDEGETGRAGRQVSLLFSAELVSLRTQLVH